VGKQFFNLNCVPLKTIIKGAGPKYDAGFKFLKECFTFSAKKYLYFHLIIGTSGQFFI
jgi:hypothetical protein